MLITIPGVLDADTLTQAQELTSTLAWRDGAETAGPVARAVKKNQQADLSSRTGQQLRDCIKAALEAHPVLRAAAQPKRWSQLIVSRTDVGGGYGMHSDNAYMGVGQTALRTDLSFTLFLSDPQSYEGGELSIEHAGMTQDIKLPAGDLVLYASSHLHQVRPVSTGTRLACVGWIESRIRRDEDRETLFDLENLRASLAATHDAQSPEQLILMKTISNLLRRWG